MSIGCQKMKCLHMDYKDYLRIYQGFFVMRCQLMNIEYQKIRAETDLCNLMINTENFKQSQTNFKMSGYCGHKKTIVIDIEKTLLTKLDIKTW